MNQPDTGAGRGRHQRINERLEEYWESLRRGRAYPGEKEIDPRAIADIWDSCFLIRVDGEALEKGFKYTYLGLSLIEAYGDDLTGQEVCGRLVTPQSGQMVRKFHEVAESGRPVNDEGGFANRKNMLVKYRSVMLPLGAPPDRVEYIIGGMKWRAF